MSYEPPFKLDPHFAIRAPENLSVLMVRGMYSVIEQKIGRADPDYDTFITGFNIAAWSLGTAGRRKSKKTGMKQRVGGEVRIAVRNGEIFLTGVGKKLEEEKRKLPDTKEKIRKIAAWAEQLKKSDPLRATMTYEEYKRRG